MAEATVKKAATTVNLSLTEREAEVLRKLLGIAIMEDSVQINSEEYVVGNAIDDALIAVDVEEAA